MLYFLPIFPLLPAHSYEIYTTIKTRNTRSNFPRGELKIGRSLERNCPNSLPGVSRAPTTAVPARSFEQQGLNAIYFEIINRVINIYLQKNPLFWDLVSCYPLKCYRRSWQGDRTAVVIKDATCSKSSRLACIQVIVCIVRSAVAYARGSSGRGGGRGCSIIRLVYLKPFGLLPFASVIIV